MIKFLTKKDIFYLDASGFDIDMQKQYGYWNKSDAEKSGSRKDKRISIIAVIANYTNPIS